MTLTSAPARQGGPPPGVLAGTSLLLLVAGLAAGAALGGTIPSPFGDGAQITAFFADHPTAVLVSAVFTFASAVPLGILAATLSSRLRTLGVTAPGATIALAGGVVASSMLALSGLLTWVLARTGPSGDAPLVRALHDLTFLTGGVAHVVFLGLLIAGVAVPALLLGLLPRAVAITGLVIAAVAEISVLALVVDVAAVLLPLARFPALIWLVVVGFQLPERRARTQR